MLIVKCLLILIVMVIMPLMAGDIVARWTRTGEHTKLDNLIFRYIIGNITMWAAFEIIGVPLILMKRSFMTAVYVWSGVMAVLLICDGIILAKYIIQYMSKDGLHNKKAYTGETQEIKKIFSGIKNIFTLFIAAATLGLIIYQCVMYVGYIHIDQDDTRFVVNACQAYDNNTMLLNNPVTGEYEGTWIGELSKDVVSPWMIYVAVLSKAIHVYPTIVAHTILPPFLILIAYAAYWLLARRLFGNDDLQSAWLFTFFSVLINMFFWASAYTSSVFFLSRIWQGKAVVAGVILPVILYLIYSIHQNPNRTGKYVVMALANIAACLMSGMGVILAPALTAFMGCWYMLWKRKWKQLFLVLLSCVPNLVAAILYLKVK